MVGRSAGRTKRTASRDKDVHVHRSHAMNFHHVANVGIIRKRHIGLIARAYRRNEDDR